MVYDGDANRVAKTVDIVTTYHLDEHPPGITPRMPVRRVPLMFGCIEGDLQPAQLGGQHLASRAGLIFKRRRRKCYLQLRLIALNTNLGLP